jgi:hypothetical protein
MTQATLFGDFDLPPAAEALVREAEDLQKVDDAVEEAVAPSYKFAITSYGADLSVFDLIRRIGKDLLIPPAFQRKYVWNQPQASRFVESILMGLPVPGIFIFGDRGKQQLIVDGQQRLITLDRFLSGVWEHRTRKQGDRSVTSTLPFRLVDVAKEWEGKTWADLESDEQEAINSFLIHATIFRQDGPPASDRSIYEVFERINTGGARLSPQEIRACVSHGSFVEFLHALNQLEEWREVYGAPSPRLKDEELILRFFAFMDRGDAYKRPMTEFLDRYLDDNRDIASDAQVSRQELFAATVSTLHKAVGPKRLFRPEKALNAAVFDGVMVGCARRLQVGPAPEPNRFAEAYEALLSDGKFIDAYKRATADDENVKTRLSMATEAFARA